MSWISLILKFIHSFNLLLIISCLTKPNLYKNQVVSIVNVPSLIIEFIPIIGLISNLRNQMSHLFQIYSTVKLSNLLNFINWSETFSKFLVIFGKWWQIASRDGVRSGLVLHFFNSQTSHNSTTKFC